MLSGVGLVERVVSQVPVGKFQSFHAGERYFMWRRFSGFTPAPHVNRSRGGDCLSDGACPFACSKLFGPLHPSLPLPEKLPGGGGMKGNQSTWAYVYMGDPGAVRVDAGVDVGLSSLGSLDRDRMVAAIAATEWKKSQGQLVGEGFTELIKRYDPMWDWYVHMTFRLGNTRSGSMGEERADVLYRRFLDQLNVEIYGRNYKRRSDRGVLSARSTEKGGFGGLLHFHGLIGRVPKRIQRVEWKERWNGLAGFARIFKYDPSLGGAAYLCKAAYAWKRGEIDFLGPWDHVESIMRESYRAPELFVADGLQGSL